MTRSELSLKAQGYREGYHDAVRNLYEVEITVVTPGNQPSTRYVSLYAYSEDEALARAYETLDLLGVYHDGTRSHQGDILTLAPGESAT